jgi:MFS family permease
MSMKDLFQGHDLCTISTLLTCLYSSSMKKSWITFVLPIAAIFSFRMLGLFMLIPVFSVSAVGLTSATPALIGVALGAYGLSQGLLQIPFGMLSDRFGRKPIITLGLLLFICGSMLGAYTHSIYGMIAARIIQGMGAIGSVLIALLADLTPDSDRTKGMAVIGVTIGMSFSLAMVISPALNHLFGLSGIFYMTASLGIIGVIVLHTNLPTPSAALVPKATQLSLNQFLTAFKNKHLQRLNIGIFCQHLILTSSFFAIPMILQQHVQLGHLAQLWHFYLPLMIVSFLAMIPFIIVSEKKQRTKRIFLSSIIITGLSQWVLATASDHWMVLCFFMFTYFVAFNILEASLPSMVSKQASSDGRGTAMGIYSSSQFLGIFAGGTLSGILYPLFSNHGIFIVNGLIAVIWSVIAMHMTPDPDPS